MRPLLALLGLMLCAGCGPQAAGDPFTDSRIPPALEQRFLPPEGWAWGLIRIGDEPPIRYGVAAPPVRPRGDVLIACGYGESAEAWFETARALVAQGYAVWIVDGAGQGGSGRYARPRDLGHVSDLDVQAKAMTAMTAVIGRPAVLVAQSTAAPSALAALLSGMSVRAAVLSAPVLDAAQPPLQGAAALPAAGTLAALRLGWLRASGQTTWLRADPLPKGRAGVVPAWQAANPDLRMGGASFGYLDAFRRQTETLAPERLATINTPLIILQPAAEGGSQTVRRTCQAIRDCIIHPIAGGGASLHLEPDAVYGPWSTAIGAALSAAYPAS